MSEGKVISTKQKSSVGIGRSNVIVKSVMVVTVLTPKVKVAVEIEAGVVIAVARVREVEDSATIFKPKSFWTI